MRILWILLCLSLIVLIAAGCASIEHNRAVQRGETPWYLVRITSPDAEIQEGEMKIYKLLRKADSPEGQKEGLKDDKQWGEGFLKVDRKDHGTILTQAQISWDQAVPQTCIFQVNAIYTDIKDQFVFSFESKKADACEKAEFESPYFIGRIQTEDRKWMTLNYQFLRRSDAN
ncbi:MAG: hypothetical protein AABZ15_02585 [Nitrospirota bacterium]